MPFVGIEFETVGSRIWQSHFETSHASIHKIQQDMVMVNSLKLPEQFPIAIVPVFCVNISLDILTHPNLLLE